MVDRLVKTLGALARDRQALQRAGRAADAAAVYRQFIGLRPDVVEARVNLAGLLMGMGASVFQARRLSAPNTRWRSSWR